MRDLVLRLRSYWHVTRTNRRVGRAVRQGQTLVTFGPSSLNLMMIDACNSQCVMCGHDYRSCGSAESLTIEKIRRIYRHLDVRQIVEVIYGGGGEPFLNPELADIAEYTRQCQPVVQHTVISNFISCDETTVARLLAQRVHFLVSVNAARRETFEAIAGVDAYGQVVDHLKRAVQRRRNLRSGSNLAVSIILMRQNIEELSDFVDLAADAGVDAVKAVYTRIYPESCRQKAGSRRTIRPEDSLFFHQELSDRAVRAACARARERGISFTAPALFSRPVVKSRDCTEPWRSLYIDPRGRLFPCAASEIHFKRKIESGRYDSGNILDRPIGEIWNNPFWQALRRSNLRAGSEAIVPECACCGMTIGWSGPCAKDAHLMDWRASEDSSLRL